MHTPKEGGGKAFAQGLRLPGACTGRELGGHGGDAAMGQGGAADEASRKWRREVCGGRLLLAAATVDLVAGSSPGLRQRAERVQGDRSATQVGRFGAHEARSSCVDCTATISCDKGVSPCWWLVGLRLCARR